MNIIDKFLTINEYSRPGKLLKNKLAIIYHYTGTLKHSADQVWNYFESGCPKEKHYSSAHYIIDFDGRIIHTIPDNEVAYHCGSSIIDPISEIIYTDWARSKFGTYANIERFNDPKKVKLSPNQVTIGIELCAYDEYGNFRDATISAAINLGVKLCKENNLNTNDIGTHNMVVGWKSCPKLWTEKPYLFNAFVEDIKRGL